MAEEPQTADEPEYQEPCNVRIEYIPRDWTSQQLTERVAQFLATDADVPADDKAAADMILSSHIMRYLKTQESRGYGFVLLPSRDIASAVVERLTGAQCASKRLKCTFAKSQPKTALLKHSRNLHIAYLPTQYTREQLRSLFTPYGAVQRCKLIDFRREQDIELGEYRSGLVKMRSEGAAERALLALHGRRLPHHAMPLNVTYYVGGDSSSDGGSTCSARSSDVGSAPGMLISPHLMQQQHQQQQQQQQSSSHTAPHHTQRTQIFVGNFPGSVQVDKETLLGLFGGFGEVVEAHSASRGRVGFVTFADVSSAREAIESMNGYRMEAGDDGDDGLKVSLAWRKPSSAVARQKRTKRAPSKPRAALPAELRTTSMDSNPQQVQAIDVEGNTHTFTWFS